MKKKSLQVKIPVLILRKKKVRTIMEKCGEWGKSLKSC